MPDLKRTNNRRKMQKKWNIPLINKPKIEAIKSGELKQIIEIGDKFIVGDKVSFHEGEGVPYSSKWLPRTEYFTLNLVIDITLFESGISLGSDMEGLIEWDHKWIDSLATEEGLFPQTGEELGRVLKSYHKIPDEGTKAQILRW